MRREEIELRIRLMEKRHAEARHPKDIKAAAEALDRLIMMEADDEREPHK